MLAIVLAFFILTNSAASAQQDEPAPIGPAAEPYSLHGFTLGMTIEEFRATEHPNDPGATIFCSGEGPMGVFRERLRTRERRCAYFRGSPGSWVSTQMSIDGATIQRARFDFILAPDDRYRLFHIGLFSQIRDTDRLLSIYTRLYGEPELTRASVESRLGTVLERISAHWSNAYGAVILRSRVAKAYDLYVDYVDHELWNLRDQRLQTDTPVRP